MTSSLVKFCVSFLQKIGRVLTAKLKLAFEHCNYHPLKTIFYLIFFGLTGFIYWSFVQDMPSPYLLAIKQPNASTRIYDRSGNLLFKFYGPENRTLIPYEEIPDYIKKATIAIEDQNFFNHQGLSPKGIARAFYYDFLHQDAGSHNNSSWQGGSTITQQLVKNALLTPERTWERKVKEGALSIAVELIFSKDQILNMYLNQVNYGGASYGIEEASQTYFGKSARHLNLAEAALLAGLPASPTTFSPFNNMKLAKARQKLVLDQLVNNKEISPEQAKISQKEILTFAPQSLPIKAAHFVMFVKNELVKRYGEQMVERGGLQVYTTLDLKTQEMAEKVVRKNIDEIKDRFNAHNGSAIVTAPKTGEILAMVGSANYFDLKNDGNVNLTNSNRQPGSSGKVILYAYALEHGKYTPSTILMDTPASFSNAWETYTPVNYDGAFWGPVTLKMALANSRNLPAVKTLLDIGVDNMVEQGRKMGITTWTEPEKYGLSLALGSAEVKMVDMATVFGTIANMGMKKNVTPIKKVMDSQGHVIQDISISKKLWAGIAQEAYASEEDPTEPGKSAISPFTAWQLIDILSDNAARAREFGANSPLYIKDRQVFVKTGTSNEFRDNWTNGCSPDYCVLTWVGNNNNKPMFKIASGITGAAPMWHDIMQNLTINKQVSTFPTPEGMIEVEVCATNGLLPCSGCPQLKKAKFVPGTEPKQKCYFPTPQECQAKKAGLEAQGKPAEEIVRAMAGCPLAAPSSTPNP